jgi:hypothetical protein
LRIPKSIDLSNCKIKLSYDASTPPATEGGTLASNGSIRFWKKQSNVTRNPAQFGGENSKRGLITFLISGSDPINMPYFMVKCFIFS